MIGNGTHLSNVADIDTLARPLLLQCIVTKVVSPSRTNLILSGPLWSTICDNTKRHLVTPTAEFPPWRYRAQLAVILNRYKLKTICWHVSFTPRRCEGLYTTLTLGTGMIKLISSVVRFRHIFYILRVFAFVASFPPRPRAAERPLRFHGSRWRNERIATGH